MAGAETVMEQAAQRAFAQQGRDGGLAFGMQATARLLGTTLGTTVVGLCFQLAGAGGARVALLAAIGFALAAGALSLVRGRMG